MIRLLPLMTTSQDYMRLLNARLWEMTRPLAVQQPEDTHYALAEYVHPTSGMVALNFEGDTQPIHTDAIPTRLTEVMYSATELEKQETIDAVNAARQTRVDPASLLPARFFDMLIDEQTAKEEGWFGPQ